MNPNSGYIRDATSFFKMFYRNFEIFFFNSIMDQDLRTVSNVSIGVLLMKLQVFEICVFMDSKSKHPEKLTQP